MPKAFPDFERHIDAGRPCPVRQARGIVQQDFVIAHVNQQRRQSVQVAIQRRNQWMISRSIAAIAIRHYLNARGA